MDKCSCKEGRDEHTRKQLTASVRRSQQQKKPLICCVKEEGHKAKSMTEFSFVQKKSQLSPSDANKLMQSSSHQDKQISPGKGEGKCTCLHPCNVQTTDHLAKKRNCKRHSYHSAPTQNSETVAAPFTDAKSDFISRRSSRGRRPLSPTRVTQSGMPAHSQLMDVLKRLQKLEDLQHVRNIELAKVRNASLAE